MSKQFLTIGACGWEHPQWDGDFYPDDLPPEWRLGYYGNEFPVVLIPAIVWLQGSADVASWLDETHEAPDFVCECPLSQIQADDFANTLAKLRLLQGRLLAILIPLDAPVADSLTVNLQQLEQLAPLVLESSERNMLGLVDTMQSQLRNKLSLAWHGEPDAIHVLASGDLALARIDKSMSQPRVLRRVLETLLGAAAGKTRVLLLFDGNPPSIEQMHAAGVIMDLL